MNHGTNQNSYVVSKSRCPQCSKLGNDTRGDNLVTYSDDHSFCFACGYLLNSDASRLSHLREQSTIQLSTNPVYLPKDVSIDYPDKVINWISSYDLTVEDLHKHNALWSNNGIKTRSHGQVPEVLIFPVWQQENLVLYTGRYFGTDNKPKWLMKGDNKSIVHLINRNAKIICIVEDIISGIKITKANKDFGALVLFNSHNPINKIKAISNYKTRQFYLWLDNDKFRDSIFFVREAVNHGVDIKTTCSKNDPKDESLDTINKRLRNL